jgi:hypothetical protein
MEAVVQSASGKVTPRVFEGWVQNACHAPETGCHLLQQFKPFAADFRFECAEASDVRAGPSEALDITRPYRVGNGHEYDWIGILEVARCPAAGVPLATIASGARETRSAADVCARVASPIPQR